MIVALPQLSELNGGKLKVETSKFHVFRQQLIPVWILKYLPTSGTCHVTEWVSMEYKVHQLQGCAVS